MMMRLVVEIITGSLFYVEVDDNATVRDLKREIGTQGRLSVSIDRLIIILVVQHHLTNHHELLENGSSGGGGEAGCCCSYLMVEEEDLIMMEGQGTGGAGRRADYLNMLPQHGGNSRMDDDRPEMMVHGPQDRGKTMRNMSELIKRDDEKAKYVSWSNAEATVISEDEITPAENAKGPVEQTKARRTRKTFSMEEMNGRKEAARRKITKRKEESRQERAEKRKHDRQILQETQQKKEAETSPVWFSKGKSQATQAIDESVVMRPEKITISPPMVSEIMSEPRDKAIQLSRPLPSIGSQTSTSRSSEVKALEVSVPESSSIPEQIPVPEYICKPIYVSSEKELKPEIEMEMISSEPQLIIEEMSLERSEDSQMKIRKRGKIKSGLLSPAQFVSSELPSHELMPEQNNTVRHISSSSEEQKVPLDELMLERNETVRHISFLNEEHKEPVLLDSSSSLSRTRKMELLEGISSPSSVDGYCYMIKENEGLTEAPEKEEWVQAHVISLMGNKLSVLPESPDCKRLLKLSLKRNYRLRAIQESFFKNMPMLQFLNLSETRIKSLPLSIFMLSGLRVLLLRGCERLTVLPPQVGSLKCLEILDLQGTNIKEVPNEVGELTRLVTLELSFHEYDTNNVMFPPELIPGGIISKLSLLKHVRIVVDSEDQRWNANVKSVTKELSNLNELSTLHFYFPEGHWLERFLQLSTSWKARKISKFRFIVGHHVKRLVSRVPDIIELEYEKRDKCLRFVNGESFPDALVEVLKCSTAFYLDRHCGIHSLSEIGIENMNNLEFCIIRECNEMTTVIDDELEVTVEGGGVLASLGHLKIHYSKNLTNICKGVVQKGSLTELKSLALYTCPKLIYIFTLSMFHSLSNLEEMVVENCQSLKVLIAEEVIEDGIVVEEVIDSRLKRLSLWYLPKFVSMGKGVSSWHLLENIEIFNCPNLKSISLDSKSAANIREIKGEKDWWSALEWEESAVLLQLETRFINISDDSLLKSD